MKSRTLVILVVALAAGVAAAYGVSSRGPLRRASDDADYYCYQMRQAWVCADARRECEARLAREAAADIRARCTPRMSDPPSP